MDVIWKLQSVEMTILLKRLEENVMAKYDVHGTVPVVVHITVEAENGNQAMEIAAEEFRGVFEYVGNGGYDKLIGVEGENETITIEGSVEFDDYTEH